MMIEKTDDAYIHDSSLCTVTKMGNIIEVRHMDSYNTEMPIKVISANQYIKTEDIKSNFGRYYDDITGEYLVPIYDFKLNETKMQSKESLRRTFKRLRERINANFFGEKNEIFITLTYRWIDNKPMTDEKKLYKDFDLFIKNLKNNLNTDIRYINVVEPQQSGSWHCHLLVKAYELESLFVPHSDLLRWWKHGSVNVKRLDTCDNIGAYLSAYLSDVECDVNVPIVEGGDVFEKNVVENGHEVKKKFIKGMRLRFYKKNMQIARYSRNLLKVEKVEMEYIEIKKNIGCQPIFKRTISLKNDNEYTFNNIQYEVYNVKRSRNSQIKLGDNYV